MTGRRTKRPVLIAAIEWAIVWAFALGIGTPALAQGEAPRSLSEAVRIEPERIEFPRGGPDEVFDFTIRVINDSDEAVGVMAATPNCPCTKTVGFRPSRLAPGEIVTINAQITASEEIGKTQGAMVLVMLQGGLVLPCSLSITTIDPRLRAVERYLEAMDSWGENVAQRFVSLDARRWFLTREGEGAPFFSRGAWADWDEFFRSEREILSIEFDGDEVVVTSAEINDFYRLIEREPTPTTTRYWFDDEGKILGKVFEGRAAGERPDDRLEEFVDWLRARDPEVLARLMPVGEVDPSLERAIEWKALLIEWRRASGLGEAALEGDDL